jgi:NADPH:quinone reductase-like Zn-dependent oxidoreductase
MTTMKAMLIRQTGPLDLLHMEEIERPTPAKDEVLVRVHAAGVNPLDWKLCIGMYDVETEYSLPFIPGFDVAGVVEEVGAEVEDFAVGDEVFGHCEGGGYAEFARVPASTLVHKPAGLDFVRAAAIPIAGLTAWQCLFDGASLQPGQRLLIQGAAGGVGSFGVQLAKWRGAYVAGTASARNHAFLRELGADQAIDYNTTRFEEVLGPNAVDVVFDTVGAGTQARSLSVLKPQGVLVSIVDPDSPAIEQTPRYKQFGLYSEPPANAQMAEMARLIVAGHLRPIISTVLPLAQAVDAYRMLEARHTRGKIVLRVIDE